MPLPSSGVMKADEIAVHELRVVSRVDVAVVQDTVGIMHGDVEGAEGHQRAEIRHGIATGLRIGLLQGRRQRAVHEILADFHRMARKAALHEPLRQQRGKILHALRTHRYTQ
jgi:hypothetical protein